MESDEATTEADADLSLTPRERGVVLTMLSEESFTIDDLVDLTGLSRSNLGKIKFALERKAPGLLRPFGRVRKVGPGPRPVVWQIDSDRAADLVTVPEPAVEAAAPAANLPGFAEATAAIETLEEGLPDGGGGIRSDERIALVETADHAENLLERARHLGALLASEGRLPSGLDAKLADLDMRLSQARQALAVHARREAIRISDERAIILDALTDAATDEARAMANRKVDFVCSPHPNSEQAQPFAQQYLVDIASVMSAMHDAETPAPERARFRDSFDDDVFCETATEALCEVVRSAGEASEFEPLAEPMMDVLSTFMSTLDSRLARRLIAVSENPRLAPDIRGAVRRLGESLMGQGELPDQGLSAFSFANGLIEKAERLAGQRPGAERAWQ